MPTVSLAADPLRAWTEHTTDQARALGADDRFTDEELGHIEAALAGFGDALYGPGSARTLSR